jgi:hypothetical protein
MQVSLDNPHNGSNLQVPPLETRAFSAKFRLPPFPLLAPVQILGCAFPKSKTNH